MMRTRFLFLVLLLGAAWPPQLPAQEPPDMAPPPDEPAAAGRLTNAMRLLRGAALLGQGFEIGALFDAVERDLFHQQWLPRDPGGSIQALAMEVRLEELESGASEVRFRAEGSAVLLEGRALRPDRDEEFWGSFRVSATGGVEVADFDPGRLADNHLDWGLALGSLPQEAREVAPRLLRRLRRHLWWKGAELAGPLRLGVVGRELHTPGYLQHVWFVRARVRRGGKTWIAEFTRRKCCS